MQIRIAQEEKMSFPYKNSTFGSHPNIFLTGQLFFNIYVIFYGKVCLIQGDYVNQISDFVQWCNSKYKYVDNLRKLYNIIVRCVFGRRIMEECIPCIYLCNPSLN